MKIARQALRIVGLTYLFLFVLWQVPCLGENMNPTAPEAFDDGAKQLQIIVRKATVQEDPRLAPFAAGECTIEVKNIGKAEITLSAHAPRDSELLRWTENSDFAPYHKSEGGAWKAGHAAPGSYLPHARNFSLASGASKEIALRFAVGSSQIQRPFRIDFFISVVGSKRKLFVRSEEFQFEKVN